MAWFFVTQTWAGERAGMPMTTNRDWKTSLRFFLLELAFYAALVVGYFFLVLALMGKWLLGLFEHHRQLYAVIALTLMVGQGFGLEALTRGLIGWLEPQRRKDER